MVSHIFRAAPSLLNYPCRIDEFRVRHLVFGWGFVASAVLRWLEVMIDGVFNMLFAYLVRYIVSLIAEIDLRVDEYLAIDCSDGLFNNHIFIFILHVLILI